MKAFVCIALFTAILWTPILHAQDIEAQLAGSTGSSGFTVFNSNRLQLFSVRGNSHVGIGAVSPSATLHIIGDDGFLAVGTLNSGNIPATGAGTRMMWYPKKAAFRAGIAGGTEWDDTNIGLYSFAAGYHSLASGSGSFAVGESIASGNFSSALGNSTEASGDYSFTAGRETLASGLSSTATGYQATASGTRSVAMGNSPTASGPRSVAIGNNVSATGSSATAFGYSTDANGDYSVAMGNTTEANGKYSTAMGRLSEANGDYSAAMGRLSEANGDNSVALGYSTFADSYTTLAIGRNNVGGGTAGSWVDTDPLFEVGIGYSPSNRANALTIWKNGNATFHEDVVIQGVIYKTFGTLGLKVLARDPANNNAYWVGVPSDRKLKQNVIPITNALERIDQLNPVSFEWNQDGLDFHTRDIESSMRSTSGTQEDNEKLWAMERAKRETALSGSCIGLIAQELRNVYPDWVREEDGYLQIDTDELVFVLTAAIRELRAEKDAEITLLRKEQDAHIASLQRQVSELRNKLIDRDKEYAELIRLVRQMAETPRQDVARHAQVIDAESEQ